MMQLVQFRPDRSFYDVNVFKFVLGCHIMTVDSKTRDAFFSGPAVLINLVYLVFTKILVQHVLKVNENF